MKKYTIYSSLKAKIRGTPFDHSGHVYIYESTNGLVKIGVSRTPSRRIPELCSQSGFGMRRCAISIEHVNYKKNEELLLRMFSESRTFGEWVSAEFDAVVAALAKLEMSPGRHHRPDKKKINLNVAGGPSIRRQKGSPFWYVSITLPGNQRICKTTKTTNYEEALKIGIKLKKEAFDQFMAGGEDTANVRQIINSYLDARQDLLSHKSYVTHAKPVINLLGETSIYSIDKEVLNEFVTARRAAGIKGSTINRELAVLSVALNNAKRQGAPVTNLVGYFRQVESSTFPEHK